MTARSRFRTIACLVGWAGWLATAAVVGAAAAAPTPEEVFRSHHLIRSGFRLVLPAEATVHDAAKGVRTAQAKLAAEAAAGRDLDAKLARARAAQKRLDEQMRIVGDKLAANPKDNQLVGQTNSLLAQIRGQRTVVDDLVARQSKVTGSRSAYITAALAAAGVADANAHAYDPLAADAALAAAVAQANAAPGGGKVKLGPSPTFTDDLAFLAKCRREITSGTIPVTVADGVPMVEVLLNGTVRRTMIWDSGASVVSITAKTAHELGRDPGPDDPVVVGRLADGREVKERMIRLAAVRVGAFTVTDVECVVLPADVRQADELLGGSFQHRFQCQLDTAAGTLRLTPLDATVTSATTQPAAWPAPTPARPAAVGGDRAARWVVLFRSDDPSIWNRTRGRPTDRNGFATPVDDAAPDDTRYLRVRRLGPTGTPAADAAFIRIDKPQLTRKGDLWCGTDWNGYQAYHLGLKNPAWKRLQKGLTDVDGNHQGWGFGHVMYVDGQGYNWAGKDVERYVLEVSVTAGELTAAEEQHLVGEP